jgi:hypothetical protein
MWSTSTTGLTIDELSLLLRKLTNIMLNLLVHYVMLRKLKDGICSVFIFYIFDKTLLQINMLHLENNLC